MLVSSLDVYPTFAAVAGAEASDNLDGVNLLPYLTGEKDGVPHDALYFRWYDTRNPSYQGKIIRSGPWRLVTYHKSSTNKSKPSASLVTELFNVEEDPGETQDLTDRHREVMHELTALYQEWEKTLPPIDHDFKYAPGIQMPSGYGWAYARERK